jgi:hypothetical protein
MPALIEPPGELMYSAMSFSLSAEASSSSCAQIRLVTSSLTSLPRKMIRSRSSRSKTWSSKDAPFARITSSSTLMAPPSRTAHVVNHPFTSGRIRCRHNPGVPEGHTIHRLAARHRDLFAGRRARVQPAGPVRGRRRAGSPARTCVDTEAYGKHLLHHFDSAWRCMSTLDCTAGSPTAAARAGPGRPGADADDGDRHWLDLRGPRACEVLDPAQGGAVRSRLGADPLRDDADPGSAYAAVHRSRRPIFALLLDQTSWRAAA